LKSQLIIFINIAKYRTLRHKSSFPRRNYIVAGAFAVNLTLSPSESLFTINGMATASHDEFPPFPCFRIPPERRSGFRGGAAAQRPRAAAALRRRARQDLQSVRVVRQVSGRRCAAPPGANRARASDSNNCSPTNNANLTGARSRQLRAAATPGIFSGANT
jgi:hypothetical protein